MIRVDKGEVALKGTNPYLLSEVTMACRALKESMLDDGISVDKAKKCLQRSLDLAFMSDEELAEEVKKATLEILLKGLGE